MSDLKRKGSTKALQLRNIGNQDGSNMPVLIFPMLEELGIVNHFFTTRAGGVSSGIFASMNVSSTRGDAPENVQENFRRVAHALGTDPEHLVLSDQQHHTNIRRVTAQDGGKGIVRPKDYSDVDGLITNETGIGLVTLFADCVPLMFVDPLHRAIGSAHSGWRGTVAKIGAAVLKRMHEEFGTDPADVYACIGPSICQDCYEVSDDVAEEFIRAFPAHQDALLTDKHNGHQQLNLWEACRITLLESGVAAEHISVTDICTCENADLLFSHRASRGRRGNFCGCIMLKEQ